MRIKPLIKGYIKPLIKGLTGAGDDFIYIVDEYAPAMAASLNYKLSSTAIRCFRIRRFSDNAELDIGFVGNKVDRDAISTFCAGTDGFICEVEDQAGGDRLAQTTANLQPRIYDNILGFYEQDNGDLAAYVPDSSARHIDIPSTSADTFNDKDTGIVLFLFKADSPLPDSLSVAWWFSAVNGINMRFGLRRSNTGNFWMSSHRAPDGVSGPNGVSSNAVTSNTTLITSHSKFDEGTAIVREDGVQTGSDVLAQTSNTTNSNSTMQHIYSAGLSGRYTPGYWSEFLAFNDDTHEGSISTLESIYMSRAGI